MTANMTVYFVAREPIMQASTWLASQLDMYVARRPIRRPYGPRADEMFKWHTSLPATPSEGYLASEPIGRLGGPQANPTFMWPASQYHSLLRGPRANHAGVYVAREPN